MNDLIATLEDKYGQENTAAFADDLAEIITREADAVSCIQVGALSQCLPLALALMAALQLTTLGVSNW